MIDLDPEADRLWVLTNRPCTETEGECLWMGTLDAAGDVTTLFDEQARYADLSLSNLIFAQQWNERLVVAGQGGIFAYDPGSHTWEQLFDQDVTVTLGLPQGNGFYFAYPDGVGRIRDATIERWELAGEAAVRLSFGNNAGEVLALTDKGNLFAVGQTEQAIPVFQTAGTTLDPEQFRQAVNLGEEVLLIGNEGALLHNVVRRTYTDIPARQLPDWMQQDGLQAHRSGSYVYFFVREGSQWSVYPTEVPDLLRPATYANTLQAIVPFQLDTAPDRVWNWPGIGLGLIGDDGSVFAVTSTGISRRTGPPLQSADSLVINDVTALGTTLVMATNGGMRYYDGNIRDWVQGPEPDTKVVELDRFQGRIFGRSDQGTLLAIDQPVRELIGAADGSQIADSALSDARVQGSDLYLARRPRGALQFRGAPDHPALEPSLRWRCPDQGAHRRRATCVGQRTSCARRTSDRPRRGPVAGLSVADDTIWTLRRDDTHLYLKGYPSNAVGGNQARCLFRNPWTPRAATRIDDARELPSGQLVMTSDAGLMVYAPQARSWYAAPATIGATGGRLYLLGDHLALAEPLTNTSQLSLIPLDTLQIPNSCSTNQVSLNAQPVAVRAAAFDEQRDRAAWITPAGALLEWQAGQTTEVLAAEGGPAGSSLRRVFDRSGNGELLFSSDDGFWRYSLANHAWSQISLQFDATSVVSPEINLNGDTVTVRSGDRWFSGQLAAGSNSVALTTLLSAPISTFGAAASSLVDMAGGDGDPWIFLLNDRLRFFDPDRRVWSGEAIFPNSDPGRTLAQAINRTVAIGDNGASWWVAETTGDRPTNFILYQRTASDIAEAVDSAGNIWRLQDNNQLLRCEPDGERYTCASVYAPPMRLTTAGVQAAYEWEGITLFRTDRGLRAFDPGEGGEVPIDGAIQLGATATVRSFDRRLWLYDGANLALLTRTSEGAAARTWVGVSALIYDDTETPWARFGNEWRIWSANDWAPLSLPESAGGATFQMFLTDGGPVVALDSAGQAYRWQDAFVAAGLPLPPSVPANSVDLLLPGADGEWWVRSGNRLQHMAPGSCPGPTPTPALNTTPTVGGTPVTVTPGTSLTPVTATPTATPIPVPCLVVAGSVTLPADFRAPTTIIQAGATATGLTLTRSDGLQASVNTAATGTYTLTSTQGTPPRLLGQRENQWPTLRTNQVQLPDGSTAYDPITTLVSDPSGLFAQRPSTRASLATAGITRLAGRPALDVGWLRWDRRGAAGYYCRHQRPDRSHAGTVHCRWAIDHRAG
ncbi:MAG: hypothetical protein HC822_03800 [Oscillochloris sp.]|nr:hypothetical protein [Oscillochloris sp.]